MTSQSALATSQQKTFQESHQGDVLHTDLFKELGADLVVSPDEDFGTTLGRMLDRNGVQEYTLKKQSELQTALDEQNDSVSGDQYEEEITKQLETLVTRKNRPEETESLEIDDSRQFFASVRLGLFLHSLMCLTLIVIISQFVYQRLLNAPGAWHQS